MISNVKHRAFSFAEVMFSVVILGIGFILVAAIFPVALQQTQSTSDEAVAAQLARDAMKLIAANTTADQYPAEAGVRPFTDCPPLWKQVSSDVIDGTDSRYAWIPYFLPFGDGTVQITIVVVRRAKFNGYTMADTTVGVANGELIPRDVTIIGAQVQPDGTSTVTITKDANSADVVVGAFLVTRAPLPIDVERTFRVGPKISETATSTTWSIQAGNQPVDTGIAGFSAAVIGRDWVDAKNVTPGYDGPAQDVAVYKTLFRPSQQLP